MRRRNTSSTKAVLKLLEQSGEALSHDMIESRLVQPMNRTTIYRILNRLVEDGLAHRILAEDGKQYFALCAECEPENHHHDHLHFHCVTCERVECLPKPLALELPEGYKATNINATISGYCADCR